MVFFTFYLTVSHGHLSIYSIDRKTTKLIYKNMFKINIYMYTVIIVNTMKVILFHHILAYIQVKRYKAFQIYWFDILVI